MNQLEQDQSIQIVYNFPPSLLRENIVANKPMSCLDAAERVLREAGQALHVNALTQQMLDKGYWLSQGQTPEQTVRSAISTDIRKHGSASRFRQVGPSIFTLNK